VHAGIDDEEATMSEIEVKRIEEIEPYRGPGELEGIQFRALGRALGVTAWGMNVLNLAPGTTTYPEHDHADDGQEEVFLLLKGDATLTAGDRDYPLERGHVVRVPPHVKRNWKPGDRGVTLLALGATPGHAYEPRR
jgi:uncharacterized cupin superfamily protein